MSQIFLVHDRLSDPFYVNCFYGIGDWATLRMKELIREGIKIDYIVDRNVDFCGCEIEGIKVISHKELLQFKNINIIIGSLLYKKEIYVRLLNMGIREEDIFYDNFPEEMNDSFLGDY